MKIEMHPTVLAYHEKNQSLPARPAVVLQATELKQLARDAGADDVGLIEISRPVLEQERHEILKAYPRTRTLMSIVVRMNREPIRSPSRSVANLEFHHCGDEVNEIAHRIVRQLEDRGIGAMNPSMGFPMEMADFPGKIWVVSHKPVAVAAGLGMMGIHRNVIHPRFGNFILLGTVLIDGEVSAYDDPISYNPCLECKLCVAACPVGAISADGQFDFSACYTHNYREFMGGFTDWVEQIVDSRNAVEYRQRVTDAESSSMWQSLSFGPNYKAAYCLSVCPAGEEVIGPYLADKKEHLQEIVRPLQDKHETIYVLKNSDAQQYVTRRFPHKNVKTVGNGLRPTTIEGFLKGAPHVFQPKQSAGLNATFHFTFTGDEISKGQPQRATFQIYDQTLRVTEGHNGHADLSITAEASTWMKFLRKERHIVWALLTRKIRLKGPLKLLVAFGKCFPQ
ncbi:4Fe-4S binding protein [Planctopirus hydrillae]|uniref:4Fe-4S ferredoxin n=1 Tax=Planctopirus hydrillae TaxID=1841610 RepID=A0A1C3E4V0_9PLAN|nr:SCP2 sterol-binding domain-containing protein [Planctopirus hydrillae]ODA28254.1 4Fe-4S ferredoxin [Planctopirus hydrillae]